MAANPRRIREIHVDIFWENPTGTEAQLSKLKEAALTCPVALSIHPEIRQEVRFHF